MAHITLYTAVPAYMEVAQQLLKGMGTTLSIFALTLILALPLGLLVAFARMSKLMPLRLVATIYISILRGTPLMLQLMMVYFGPFLLFGASLADYSRFWAAIIAFTLNYAAYYAEIYRSGIQSMPLGQFEAASVLGFSRGQTFFRIILPQVLKRIMPPLTNEAITLVKDTSLAQVIVVAEMFTAARSQAIALSSFMPFAVAGLFYYIMNYAVAFTMERIEKKLNYYR